MRCRGFTLIEIVLALGLIVVLLGLLNMAVSVHIRLADAAQSTLEGSQAAQVVLRQIAADLRSTLPLTSTPYVMGGVVGDSRELQIEISHMPLLGSGSGEELSEASGGDRLQTDLPSDVRTVHYRVVGQADAGTPTTFRSETMQTFHPRSREEEQQPHGLIRIECERAALAWMLQQGDTADLDRRAKLLSSEVEAIEFTYFDGEVAYDQWDSIEKGKLPTAVLIAVAVRPPKREIERPSATVAAQTAESTVYEQLVYLPNLRSTLLRAMAEVSSQAATTIVQSPSTDTSSNSER